MDRDRRVSQSDKILTVLTPQENLRGGLENYLRFVSYNRLGAA